MNAKRESMQPEPTPGWYWFCRRGGKRCRKGQTFNVFKAPGIAPCDTCGDSRWQLTRFDRRLQITLDHLPTDPFLLMLMMDDTLWEPY